MMTTKALDQIAAYDRYLDKHIMRETKPPTPIERYIEEMTFRAISGILALYHVTQSSEQTTYHLQQALNGMLEKAGLET